MSDEIFADGFVELSVTGQVVRMDLFSLSATEKDASGSPKLAFRQRVIMPIEGFARSFGMMEGVMRRLIQDGVVTVNPDRPGAPGEKTNEKVTAAVSPRNSGKN
ncbi:Single-stranded DNA-binding protein [Azospirillaceae bacterium]